MIADKCLFYWVIFFHFTAFYSSGGCFIFVCVWYLSAFVCEWRDCGVTEQSWVSSHFPPCSEQAPVLRHCAHPSSWPMSFQVLLFSSPTLAWAWWDYWYIQLKPALPASGDPTQLLTLRRQILYPLSYISLASLSCFVLFLNTNVHNDSEAFWDILFSTSRSN